MWLSASLLALVLCTLLLDPAVGYPLSRPALPKSARGDDLLSGSDFLSVFIGAAVPRPGTAIRSRSYRRLGSVTPEESVTTVSSKNDTHADPHAISNDPQNANSFVENSSIFPDKHNNDQDPSNKVSAEISADNNNAANELDSANNAESQPSLPTTPVTDIIAQNVDEEPIGASSISSSKRVEYLSDSSNDKTLVINEDIKERSSVHSSSDSNNSSPTLGIESKASSSFLINSESPLEEDPSESNLSESSLAIERASESEDSKFNFDGPSRTSAINRDTMEDLSQNETTQVISVRVSSSVALAPPQHINKIEEDNKDVFSTFLDDFSESTEREENNEPPAENISLVTEEQPAATAIQRSQFSVEEASPSSSLISVHQETSSSVQESRSVYPPPVAIESPIDPQSSPVSYQTSVSTATSGSRVQFYSEPPSYHRTSSSSAAETVQRSVAVVRHPQLQSQQQPRFGQTSTVPLSGQQISGSNLGSSQRDQNIDSPQTNSNTQGYQEGFQQKFTDSENKGSTYQESSSRSQKSYDGYHQEPRERNYEVQEQNYGTQEQNYGTQESNNGVQEKNYGAPERIYARQEQNYEVDESVSVMSNGRAHGVQYPPATTPAHMDDTRPRDFSTQQGQARDPNSKFGYVVEGRNFRKYRVEERTPDGFIVGEYGVVSHDDGSLRGVRYTADGTINPRLIYDALVKFLSL